MIKKKLIKKITFLITPMLLLSTMTLGKNILTSKSLPNIVKQTYGLRTEVLDLALKANTRILNKKLNKQNIVSIIDYSLPSTVQRFWILDLNKDKVLFSLKTAHGKGSGDNFAVNFSDMPNSHQSSLGVFITGDTYYGKHGLSLELFGMEPKFNAKAHERRIVIHAANYVSDDFIAKYGRLGRSWGCPALMPQQTKPVIDTIKSGTMLLIYYPDNVWLKTSKYLN